MMSIEQRWHKNPLLARILKWKYHLDDCPDRHWRRWRQEWQQRQSLWWLLHFYVWVSYGVYIMQYLWETVFFVTESTAYCCSLHIYSYVDWFLSCQLLSWIKCKKSLLWVHNLQVHLGSLSRYLLLNAAKTSTKMKGVRSKTLPGNAHYMLSWGSNGEM